jgi:hypothetical protein
LILGQHAHDLDNSDWYTQQYNERGHPEFRASRAAARELRRAKNDVLSTVGVVYKKSKPHRSRRTESEAVKIADLENDVGFVLSSIDGFAMFCTVWWVVSLSRRIQVSHANMFLHTSLTDVRPSIATLCLSFRSSNLRFEHTACSHSCLQAYQSVCYLPY